MSNTSLAATERQPNPRVERGRALYRERGCEIEHLEGATWLVPGSLTSYLVNLDAETCECKDFEYRRVTCYHQVAALIAESKSRVCSCCRSRVLGRFLSEVTEEDGLLSWYPGEELCGTCIRDGYWV